MIEGEPGAPGEEREGEAVRALVAAVSSRGLEAPALLALEAARPFHWLFQQLFYVAHPLLQPWLGDRLDLWVAALEDQDVLERATAALRRTRRAKQWT